MSAAKEKKTGQRRVKREGVDNVADWASVNGELLAAVIGIVAKGGGALRFGYTRDGGAYSIGIYGDGEKPYTDYVRPSEDIEQYLRQLGEAWYTG